jgi:hypothetical protein
MSISHRLDMQGWYQFNDINSYIIMISENKYLIIQHKKYIKYLSFITCKKIMSIICIENMTNVKMALEYV